MYVHIYVWIYVHTHTHREGLLPFFTTAFLRTKIGRNNLPVFWEILILPLPKSRTILLLQLLLLAFSTCSQLFLHLVTITSRLLQVSISSVLTSPVTIQFAYSTKTDHSPACAFK